MTHECAFGCLLGATPRGDRYYPSPFAFAINRAQPPPTPAPASLTTIGEGRQLKREQQSLDGLAINARPLYLLVPPELETVAEQFTMPGGGFSGGATAEPEALFPTGNPFAGRLATLSDANLTESTRFWFFADPPQLPSYIYGFLGEATGPRTDVRQGFEVDGVEFEVSLDFGVGAIDFRGGVTNTTS